MSISCQLAIYFLSEHDPLEAFAQSECARLNSLVLNPAVLSQRLSSDCDSDVTTDLAAGSMTG